MAVVTAKDALEALPPAARAAAPTTIDLQKAAAEDRLPVRHKSPNWALRAIVAVLALASIFLALDVIMGSVHDEGYGQDGPTPAPVDGLTIFAVFFVAASAVERLLEPVASAILDKKAAQDDAAKAIEAAGSKFVAALATADRSNDMAATRALEEAAAKAATVEDVTYVRTVTFWVLATVVAMAASAFLKLYFLRTVGITSGTRTIEVLATGLIIGAGTKPLHDLVGWLSASAGKRSEAADAM
jgi:hypothetical protein